jgi:hypothetical protein
LLFYGLFSTCYLFSIILILYLCQVIWQLFQPVFLVNFSLEFSVPEILFKLKQNLLSRNGLSTEGLFRISGDELQIQRIKYVLDTNQAFDCKDAHCTASVIKLWFREMPHPLFKGIDLAKLNENSNVDEVLDVLAPAERNLLAWLVDLCALVAEHQEINKMPPKNLGMSLPF